MTTTQASKPANRQTSKPAQPTASPTQGEGSAGTASSTGEHASTQQPEAVSAGTAHTGSEAHQVQHVDPRTLLVDLNVRHDTRLDADFVASVRDLGVLVPIVAVRTADGEVRVRMGHRRTLAAIEADQPTVPVIVAADETTDDAATVHRLVTQWAENEHRAGLTTAERVDVIGQLSAFGVSPTQIARRTRASKTEVTAAITVMGSELARAATARYDFLTLDQAATVADFEDDTKAVQTLVVAARDGRFDHAAQRLRDARTEAATRAQLAATLTASGVRVVDRPTSEEAVRDLYKLTDTEGAALNPDSHAACPGHAAYIGQTSGWVTVDADGQTIATDADQDDDETDGDEDGEDDEPEGERGSERRWGSWPAPQWVCTDPDAHGHLDRWARFETGGAGGRTPVAELDEAAREAARADRRDVIDSNKAWGSAETVRRAWLAEFAARKTAPKGAAGFIAAALAHDADLVADVGGNHLAAQLLGAETGTYGRSAGLAALVERTGESRALLVTLVMVLAAYEARADRNDWRSLRPSTGRYLGYLSSLGYGLADVERRACGQDHLPSAD